MNILYLDLSSGIAGDMFIAALLDLGVDADKLERELRKIKLEGYHLHVSRQERNSISGIKFDVHTAHAHEHGHHHHEHSSHHLMEPPPHEPSPHPDPLPSHPMGAEREQQADTNCLIKARRPESGSGVQCANSSGNSHTHSHEHGRDFSEIKKLITGSKLSAWVKQKSIAVFKRIAEAEGKIHGLPAEEVSFHEVGAVDSIVDIVGAAIALEMLGKPRVFASQVIEGTGWIDCAHGRFPVPAPATLAILGARGIGITQCDEPHELVTPTGAALLAEYAEDFGAMDNLVAKKTGFGIGTRENKTRPNVLRVILGTSGKRISATPKVAATNPLPRRELDWETDRIAVLETNLDDCTGEILGHFMETALAAGALDAFHTPIQMKKNRPGVLLTVLCAEPDADRFCEMILRETTAFGVRKTIAERRKLRREFVEMKTAFGEVKVKIGKLGGKTVQAAMEYEPAKKLAAQKKVPLKQVYEAVKNLKR